MKKYNYLDKQNLKTSMDIGEITPLYWNLLNPGETIKKLSYENITRMITPIYPTLDNPKISLYAFAVPLRILRFSKPNGFNTNSDIFGQIITDFEFIKTEANRSCTYSGINRNSLRSNGNFDSHKDSLLAKFGIDLSQNNKNNSLYITYLLSYWKIYDSFFKNKQIETFNYDSWFRDLTNNGTLERINEAILDTVTDKNVETAEKISSAFTLLNKIALCNSKNDYLDSITFYPTYLPLGDNWNSFKNNVTNHYSSNKKTVEKIQNGTYKDELVNVWNVSNGDKTNPVLLGYSEFQQNISQVINQTASPKTQTSTALGDVGGMSVTYNKDYLINDYTANEPTIIMVLAVPDYKMYIKGSYDLMEWGSEFLDGFNQIIPSIFNPQMQAPYYSSDLSFMFYNNTKVYMPSFDFMRHKKDVVAGDIMNDWSNWTYTYLDTANVSSINTNLIKIIKKPFRDTLYLTETDSFICEFNFHTEILRLIKPLNVLIEDLIEGK